MQYALIILLVVAGFAMCIALFSMRDPVNLREFHMLFLKRSKHHTEDVKLWIFQGSYAVILMVSAYFIVTDLL